MSATSLDRYVEFLATLPDAVLLLDATGVITFANQHVEALLGYRSDEMAGQPVHAFVPERHRSQCRDVVAGCVAATRSRRLGEQSSFFARRRDGAEVPIDVTLAPQTFGESRSILCILRDAGAAHQLRTLAALGSALRVAQTRADLVHVLLDELLTIANATGTSLAVEIPHEHEVLIEAARGALSMWSGERVSADETITARVLASGELFVTDAVREHAQLTRWALGPAVQTLAIIPIQTGGHVFGALGVARTSSFSRADLELLLGVSDMAAVALQRTALHEQRLQEAAAMEDAYEDMLAAWARALDARERIADGHTTRVTDLTLRLARALGVSAEYLPHIRRGALLHDIGKVLVPDAVLHKPGPLDETEQTLMRRHPEYAYDLLGSSEFLSTALEIPYFHHERWDGTGYPRGLAGEEIPLAARIFAVADVYDTMTSERAYQAAQSHSDALREIVDQSGRHFDPLVVAALEALVRER